MRCRRYDRLIVLYLHDELADEARQQLEGHLDGCAMCRERLAAFRVVIERAGERNVPAPSTRTMELIRQAAEVELTESGRRAARVLLGNRWCGARVGIAAAVACVVLLTTLAVRVNILGRRSSSPPYGPPVHTAELPVPPRAEDELPLRPVVLPEESDGWIEPMRAPSDLEARLASLEANTFYIDREIAREMMPVFDRRVYGLENAVVSLALDLEQQ